LSSANPFGAVATMAVAVVDAGGAGKHLNLMTDSIYTLLGLVVARVGTAAVGTLVRGFITQIGRAHVVVAEALVADLHL